jgi:uncharacterized protein (TIGR02284 family)
MNPTTASLAELVSALNDGVAFYERLAQKVGDAELVALFLRMAALKRAIADDINAEIALAGVHPRDEGSVVGALRILYAEALGALDDRNAATYVGRLEEHEDRLLAAFREAVLAGDSAKVREIALRYYPDIERMHAQMSRLKQRLA